VTCPKHHIHKTPTKPETSYWYITAYILTDRRGLYYGFEEKKRESNSTPPRPSLSDTISEKLSLLSIIIIIAQKSQVDINIAPIVLLGTMPLPRSIISSRTAHQVIYDLELACERLRHWSAVWLC
jgi:hypothetical protein